MEAFGDVVFGGKVMLGATFFAPLMARNYQEQYGNIYAKPSDMFASHQRGKKRRTEHDFATKYHITKGFHGIGSRF